MIQFFLPSLILQYFPSDVVRARPPQMTDKCTVILVFLGELVLRPVLHIEILCQYINICLTSVYTVNHFQLIYTTQYNVNAILFFSGTSLYTCLMQRLDFSHSLSVQNWLALWARRFWLLRADCLPCPLCTLLETYLEHNTVRSCLSLQRHLCAAVASVA